jgi:hypothetical protein
MMGHSLRDSAVDFTKQLSPSTKFLAGLWILFLLLVAFGIHGSSTGATAGWWAKERPYTGYLFDPPKTLSNLDPDLLRSLFMAKAQFIRWDELLITTPLALSQLTHSPRFPVVNTNIGNGQNVLISPHVPVWHIATLARPHTWGYFFLGAQRGLAWYWWFRIFACFTVLFLLFEIILRGHKPLAAFGAFWFCGSAYVICWSLWPAQITFFVALGCLAAYHLLASTKLYTQVVAAALLGLSIPGFVMFLYPAWQVPLGYLFLLIFAGLFVRDRLYLAFRSKPRTRLLLLTGALLVAFGLTLAFIRTCLPDLKVMSNTVYPGNRISVGGDYSFAMLFKGMYNPVTIYSEQPGMNNPSEASSFYYLFPAAIIGVFLSKRLIRGLGALGWLLIAYIAGLIFFALVGVSETVAKLTLLSYVPPYRADIALGLASITLCVYALASVKGASKEASGLWSKALPFVVSGAVILFFILHGLTLQKTTQGFPQVNLVLLASGIAGFLSYCLFAGKGAAFCGVLGAVVATSAFFNPLATNLDHIYKSELAGQITHYNNQSNDKPLWLAYGGVHPGVLITALGGRSLSGIHWPPQLALWRRLDSSRGGYEPLYNRYAEVSLLYQPNEIPVAFNSPYAQALTVGISPHNPRLKRLGARYVLALGDAQKELDSARLITLYTSRDAVFTIYEIPASDE